MGRRRARSSRFALKAVNVENRFALAVLPAILRGLGEFLRCRLTDLFLLSVLCAGA